MISAKDLESIKEVVRTCKKCKLWKYRNKLVFAEGPANAEIMLIGLSPGREENSTGKLFIGPSGKLLNKLLVLAGLERKEIYITNLIKCSAPTRKITEKEIEICSPYLDKQIEIIKPKIIIPLGHVVSQYILFKYHLPSERISVIHGRVFEVSKRLKIIPMFHPAAGLKYPELLGSIERDWKELGESYTKL